jgi:hypothetical protein
VSRCEWLGRDDEGRPYCEHGPARKASAGRWRCPLKARLADARYGATDKGREARRRANAREHTRSRKAIYALTRVRMDVRVIF